MKKMKLYIISLCILSTGCGSYLDKMPEADGYAFDKVFKDSVNYKKFCEYLVMNPFFLYLENGTKPLGNYDDISDNSISTATFGGVPSVQAQAGNFYSMRSNGDAPMCNNDTWKQIWKHIRIANLGIRNIDFYPGASESRNKILGMCYFYRAFGYMELTRRWGGMPYLYSAIMDAEMNLDFPRLSMQGTYKNAALDCDSAAMYLEDVIPMNEYQHPTRVAALSLKSRILLYAASDLARLETPEGENLWEAAALAADEALRTAKGNGYDLVAMSEYYYLNKEDKEDIYAKEVLFGRRANHNWGSDAYTFTCRPPGQLSGKYGNAVNQQLVDCFEMKATGLPISDARSGYKEQNPYVGRDPRFEENIVYNQAKVMGKTMQIFQLDETKTPAVEGSMDCKVSNGLVQVGFTQTGYYAKKWMGKTHGANLPLLWPYIRLAEVYLNFAEAANEAWASPTAKDGRCLYSAEEAINVVRHRAEMLGIHTDYLNQPAFRERVRNERRVEFGFEDHRLFDIRRWKIGTQSENRDMWRMKITKVAKSTAYPTGFKYEKEFLMTRVFEDRHNLFVIKLDDTNIGPNFKQNPGW